jgi:hypothetical protein
VAAFAAWLPLQAADQGGALLRVFGGIILTNRQH